MNISVFGKTIKNVRNHRDIKIVITNKKRNKLVSEPNYHIIKHISENVLIIEMKKIEVKMNKPIYLGMSILGISKTLMYEFWCDYIKLSMEIEQNYVTLILTVSLFILKLKIFTKSLLMMLKNDLIHLTMITMMKDRFQ